MEERSAYKSVSSQWGNMLVLTAAKRNPLLGQFIDDDVLETLFDRTIGFLRQSAGLTSSLRVDAYILEGLRADIAASKRQQSGNPEGGSSFSGAAGLPTPAGGGPASAPMQRTQSAEHTPGTQLRQSAPPSGK